MGWPLERESSGSAPLASAQILLRTLEPITAFRFQLLGTHTKKAGDKKKNLKFDFFVDVYCFIFMTSANHVMIRFKHGLGTLIPIRVVTKHR